MNKTAVVIVGIIFIIGIFFYPFFLHNLLPIPADTIIGLYHPYRDLYANIFPRGVPFKNFLITDPVRQLIPWRSLSLSEMMHGQLPLWNPYEMAGTPLLANFQSAPFYPLNILLFFLPFNLGWSIEVILQPLLAGIFLYLYLRNLKLSHIASCFGGIIFALCGFSISWLEWNTVVQTVLWLPLILLAKDKLIKKWNYKWLVILLFSEISSVFAGHLQTLFYCLCVSNLYLFLRIIQKAQQKNKKNITSESVKLYLPFLGVGIFLVIFTSIQWFPTLQFILHSARNVDQADFTKSGWFIPWQNLIQFVVPDFFGNPATLNYWGVWNYGEFIGYIGVIPLFTALFSILFRRDKKTLFASLLLLGAFLFAFSTPLSILPYSLHVPFLSTAQPTRLIVIMDFALSILAALGLDYVTKKKKEYVLTFCVGLVLFILVWGFVMFSQKIIPSLSLANISIAKHNLYVPTAVFILGFILSLLYLFIKNKKVLICLSLVVVIVTSFDLIRFGQKYESFSPSQYLFPPTGALSYLKNQPGVFRVAANDSELLPPNFPTVYHIQSIEGYDPLYLLSYGEFIAAMERNRANITPPFGFNRIITPHNIDSRLMDLLNVKYVLSLTEIGDPKYEKVFQEGQTRVYKNQQVIPRAFFVKNTINFSQKQDQINEIFNQNFNPSTMAVVADPSQTDNQTSSFSDGTVSISHYSENSVSLTTQGLGEGFLVFTDTYYPTWKAYIDGKSTPIILTDYTFRGVFVPSGQHVVLFKDSIL